MALTVTANNQSRTYGDLNPALTYTITGFVNGDFLDQSELSGSPDVTTTAVDYTSPAGIYPISITQNLKDPLSLRRPQLHAGQRTLRGRQADDRDGASRRSSPTA